jgi:hypothetical protein
MSVFNNVTDTNTRLIWWWQNTAITKMVLKDCLPLFRQGIVPLRAEINNHDFTKLYVQEKGKQDRYFFKSKRQEEI